MPRRTLGNSLAYRNFKRNVTKGLMDVSYAVDELLDEIGKETVQKVRDYVRLYYYKAYPQGDNYNRLSDHGGFLGTITYEKCGATGLRIYCDWTKLKFFRRGKKLPHHIERDGSHFVQGLYDYMMYGEWPFDRYNFAIDEGFTGLDPIISEEINEWLNWYISDSVSKKLSELGLEIEYTKQTASYIRP